MRRFLPLPRGPRAWWRLRRADGLWYAAAAASGLLLALAFPLVVPLAGLREVDPAGRLELLAWIALVPAILAVRAAPSAVSRSSAASSRASRASTPRSTGSRTR
jgi:hypothetical protein